MFLALYLCASILPALYTWWRFAGWWAWTSALEDPVHRNSIDSEALYHYKYNKRALSKEFEPSIDIWVGGIFIGFLVGLIWPIVVSLIVVNKIHKKTSRGFGYIPKEIAIQQRSARIERKDKELGIG